MASLTTLPQETIQQVIKLLTRNDFANLCISHRNLYSCVIGSLYHTIHFLDSDVEVYPEHGRLFHEDYSTPIKDVSKFIRTLEYSEFLWSLVVNASFQWSIEVNDVVKPAMLRILNAIGMSLKTLHYGPPKWEFDVQKSFPITSICSLWLEPWNYSSSHLADFPDTAREHAYSLFFTPTLRHLTIQRLLSGSFQHRNTLSGMDKEKTGTSNVEHLSIQDTNMADIEYLEEMMSWPKALKVFESTLGHETENAGYPQDPSLLAKIIKQQSASLEELSVDYVKMS